MRLLIVCLEIFGCAVDVLGSILQVLWVIVPEETLPPDTPGLGVGQLGDGSVEESDGSAAVVVLGDPVDCVVDPVLLRVEQTVADVLGGRGHLVVDLLHRDPHVVHVEFVCHSLKGRPHGAEAVVVLSDVVHDLVEGLHRDGSEIRAELVLGRVRDHLDGGIAIHVHGRNAVSHRSSRVEFLQPLHGHRVDGVCNGLVEIAGEAAFLKEFHADILLGGHGVGQPNRHDEANKHGFERHAFC